MRNLLIGASMLVLTACGGGGEIDAKNADNFASSLRAMTADLTQEERRMAGAGVFLVVEDGAENHTPSLAKLRQAKNDALDVLPAGEAEEASFQRGLYREVIDAAGEELDGMSLRDLSNYVEDYEDRAFAAEIEAAEAEKSAMAAASEGAAIKTAERAEAVSKLRDEEQAPIKLAQSMIGGVQLVDIEGVSRGTRLKVQPVITVTNQLDFPIDLLSIRLELETGGFDKPTELNAQSYLSRTEEGVLAPGETRELTYPDRGFTGQVYGKSPDIPTDPTAYTVMARVDQARGGNNAWYARADSKITYEMQRAQTFADQCQKAIDGAGEEVKALEERITVLEKGEDPGRANRGYGRVSTRQLEACL